MPDPRSTRGERSHHEGLRDQGGGPGPVRPQPSSCRRVLPVGLLGDQQVARRQGLLRPSASRRAWSEFDHSNPLSYLYVGEVVGTLIGLAALYGFEERLVARSGV
jgi:hypothetical protein